MLWLLLASVIFVPVFQKIPGGNRYNFSHKKISRNSSKVDVTNSFNAVYLVFS